MVFDGDFKNYADQSPNFTGIAFLAPGSSLSKTIDVTHEALERLKAGSFSGSLSFRDLRGKRFDERITIDSTGLHETLLYDNETTKAAFELQRIPDILEGIKRRLEPRSEG